MVDVTTTLLHGIALLMEHAPSAHLGIIQAQDEERLVLRVMHHEASTVLHDVETPVLLDEFHDLVAAHWMMYGNGLHALFSIALSSALMRRASSPFHTVALFRK